MRGLSVAASVFFLIVACCPLAQAADPNMVAYWKFQNNTNDSISSNNVQLVGVQKFATGNNGLALNLSDNSYLRNSSANVSLGGGSFSISVWVKPSNVAGEWRAIMEYDRYDMTARSTRNWLGIWLSSTANFHFRVGGSTRNSVGTLQPNNWYLLTATYDRNNGTGGTFMLYINGTFDSFQTFTTAPSYYSGFVASANLTIGARNKQDAEFLNGTIDELRVWNRVLTPGEVESIYANDLKMNRDDYYNKVYGSWLGQIAGNFLGAEWEGQWKSSPLSNETIYYHSPYGSDITGTCQPDNYNTCSVNSRTDDDTSMEWVDLHMLESDGIHLTYGNIRGEWLSHMNATPPSGIYFANRCAAEQMNNSVTSYCTPANACSQGACTPPYSGMQGYNKYFDYIDAQIEIELFGLLAPGMPKVAREKADFFARVTNDGYAADFAKFYAMMYAEAFYENNVTKIILDVKSRFPPGLKVVQVVDNVINWWTTYPNWRDTRQQIQDLYYTTEYNNEANGRGAWFIHSTANFASTIMSLLYSQGDFDKGIQMAAIAGWDNDCNAPTTAGLLGVIAGAGDIPDKWKKPIRNYYQNTNRDPRLGSDTITNISNRTLALGEQFILANGGSISGPEDDYIYNIDQNAGGLPPAWDPEPVDQSVGQGQNFSYDANATDMGGIHSYGINDTGNFNINASSGVITNKTSLTPGGIYGLNISVNDTEGGTISKIITLAAGCTPDCSGLECGLDPVCGILNCGSCGADAQCSAGACSCDAGHGDCDDSWANGCETELGTDANCASCGNACGAGETCQSGVCTPSGQPPPGGSTPGFEPSLLAILVATSLLAVFFRRD